MEIASLSITKFNLSSLELILCPKCRLPFRASTFLTSEEFVTMHFFIMVSCFYYSTIPIAVDCGRLVPPPFGSVTIKGVGTLGSMATYICDDGHHLQGFSERRCEADGEWTGEIPTCIRE